MHPNLTKETTNYLIQLKRMFNSRTFINYFLVILILAPYTISDKHNRSNSIQKKRLYVENPEHVEEYPVPTQQSSGCSSCRMREEIKQRNLEVIKGEILRRMGFQQAPNITGKVLPQIPAHFLAMVEDYEMQSDQPQYSSSVSEEDDEYHMKTQKILTFAQPHPKLRHKGSHVLHFSFSDSITKFHVSNATLFIYIRGTDRRRPLPDVVIEVFKVKRITDRAEPQALQKVHYSKITQPYGKGDWVQIDLTETVSEWFKNSRENHGFIVNATANGRKVAVTDVNTDKGNKAAFVEISTLEPKRRVRRNNGLNCDERNDEPLCCRYPLMVDFEIIGFDFIIAPKRYNAHMCAGDCSYLTLQKYAHTHLTQMAVPNSLPPCCTPRKMSSISMLYFDTQLNVVFGSLPGMVVERCGCL